jgi:hypothetical protein
MQTKWSAILVWAILLMVPLTSNSNEVSAEEKSVDIVIKQQWGGDYPVSCLDRLPGDRASGVGYIADAKVFEAVWEAFKPGERAPMLDFARDFVIFVRNVNYYNRTAIGRMKLTGGVLDVVAMATLSSLPVEDRVAIVLAVVPRKGIWFIHVPGGKIPVLVKTDTESDATTSNR